MGSKAIKGKDLGLWPHSQLLFKKNRNRDIGGIEKMTFCSEWVRQLRQLKDDLGSLIKRDGVAGLYPETSLDTRKPA